MSPLSRALGVLATAGLLGTSLLASPALAADQPIQVQPTFSNNANTSATTLTITSTGSSTFTQGAAVTLSLHSDPTFQLTATQPTTATPVAAPKTLSADVTLTHAAPGAYDVLVTNAGAMPTTFSCSNCFTITDSVPTVTSIAKTPNNNPAAPTTYTITGTNFAERAKVTFTQGGVADPAIVWTTNANQDGSTTNGTTLVGTRSIGAAAAGGTYDVTVTNTDGKKGVCTGCFVLPKITEVHRIDTPVNTQAKLAYGVTNKQLVVSGVGLTVSTGFSFIPPTGTNTVTINSRTYDSSTGSVTLNVSVRVPSQQSGDTQSPTATAVYGLFATGVGDSSWTKASALILNPKPQFDTSSSGYYFDKDNPGVSQQHFKLTIYGSYFQSGMGVAFTPNDGITVNSVVPSADGTSALVDMDLAATTPVTAHTVTITNPDLGSANNVTLKPTAAPIVTSATPADISLGTTSFSLTLNGSGIGTQHLQQQEGDASILGASYDYNAKKILFLDHLGDSAWTQQGSTSGSGSAVTATMAIPANAPAGPVRIGFLDHNGSVVACKTASGGECLTIDAIGVSSVSPNFATNDGPQTFTFTGNGFTSGATVVLQRAGQPDVVGTNVRNLTATSVTADFDLDGIAPGNNAWSGRVTNLNGDSGVATGAITIAGATPRITSVSPTTLAAGNPTAVLTVNGTDLARGATLSIVSNCPTNGCDPKVVGSQWISRNQMKFTVDTRGSTVGPHDVKLSNTDGNSSPTNDCSSCLTIVSAPTLAPSGAISPASRAAGAPTFTMTVTGSGFNGKPTLAFTGTGITVGTSTLGAGGTSFTIPVTVAPDAPQTARGITVTNGDGGTVSCTSCFTVLAQPTITSITPNVQKVGTGPTTVTIKGTHFNTGGASVTFSGSGITTGTVTVSDAQTITVPVTVAAGATLGARDVTVTNTPAADGGSVTQLAGFSVANVPGVPQNLTATPGDSLVNLDWDAPASDGGVAITGYTVTVTKTADGTAVPGATVTVTDTTAQVTGLTNGTPYSFTVKATNAVGTGAATAPVSATPATVAGAPTSATAVAGEGKATVSWTAPSSNGGSPITSYKVYFAPSGDLAATTSATSVDVTGLTNGSTYKFYVVAVNAVGSSNPSNTTDPVTPKTALPGAPTNLTVSVTAASGEADLSWTAPSGATLTPISSYNVSVSPASGTNVGTTTYPADRTATTAVVTGLTNGVEYTFTVKAVDGAGAGPASNSAKGTPYGKPGAVQSLAASAGNQTIAVSWAAPASNGGSALTGYTVTLSPGGATKTVSPGTTNASFTGLTNGVEYTISVVATNARGDGPASTTKKTPTPASAALTLTSTASKVLRGQHVVLKGVLTRPDTSVAGGNVTIKVINDQGAVSTVATVVPAADGSYSYDFAPTYNGTYRAYYDGDSRNGGTNSGTARVLVAVRISATSATGPATSNATIKGSVLPNKAGQIVTLYAVNSNGTLTKITATKVSSGSTYQFTVKLSRGNHLLQVGMADTAGNAHGEVRFIAKRT